jgi:hypothetical protein
VGERRHAAVGRELDLPRNAEQRRIELRRRTLADDLDGSGREVERHDLVGDRRSARDQRDRRALGRQERGVDGREREVEVDQLPGRRIEDPRVLYAVAFVVARDPAVVEERVRGLPEEPLRPAELGVPRADGDDPIAVEPFEVPPSRPVARPVQLARGAPRRLPDRLLAARPATRRRSASEASRPSSATNTSVPSQGIHGRSHSSHESLAPSGAIRGVE